MILFVHGMLTCYSPMMKICAEAHYPACEFGPGRLHLRPSVPPGDQPEHGASTDHTRGGAAVPGLWPAVPLQLVNHTPHEDLLLLLLVGLP